MSEKQGIIALKEVVDTIVLLGKTYDKVFEDGKVSWRDSLHIGKLVPRTIKTLAKSNNVLEEIKDLDPDEREALVAYFKEHFDLKDDDAEKQVEDILSIIVEYGKLVPQALGFSRLLRK